MISPYKGDFKVTQIYKGKDHKGLDLVGLTSKKLYSTVTGYVDAVGWDLNPKNPNDRTYGMGLRLRLREETTNRRIYYAHCSEIFVLPGQRIKIGDLVAMEGSTGHSTGSHLHYEIRQSTLNSSFLDVSKISGIPNKLGKYNAGEDIDVKVSKIIVKMNGKDTPLSSIIYNNENYIRIRDLADAQTDDKLTVSWDGRNVVINSK